MSNLAALQGLGQYSDDFHARGEAASAVAPINPMEVPHKPAPAAASYLPPQRFRFGNVL
jgi:hypothetical protein